MPNRCRCGGKLMGMEGDTTAYFKSMCGTCGKVHRQRKRQKGGKEGWPFHKILEACMDRYPEQRVGQIIWNALSLWMEHETKKAGVWMKVKPDIFHVENEDLKKALIHYTELPEPEEARHGDG